MQDEHFMRLWVEAHTFWPASGDVSNLLQNRLSAPPKRVDVIDKPYGQPCASLKPLPGQRAQRAYLFAWAIPAGVLAGIAAAAIAVVSAPVAQAPLADTAHTDTARFELPYTA